MEGNQMKMRAALIRVLRLANVTADGENRDWNNAIAENTVKVVKEALSTPPRNCDIGTAVEQSDRFANLCDSYHCSQCPVNSFGDFVNSHRPPCGILWGQMPYAEEGDQL